MAGEDYLIRIQLQVQNDKALKRLTTELDKAAKKAPEAQRAMKQATAGTKRFGNVAQNAGYQIQDMVVQIQGGVSPMRAMSQQLPQMLVGFGAWGAAIGVVAALLPTLVTLMKGTNDELKDTEETADAAATAADRLAEAFSDMGQAVDQMNLDSFVDQFNKAGEAQSKLLLQTLEFRRVIAELAVDDALQKINLPLDVGFESGQGAREAYLKQMERFAESVGVTNEQMILLERNFRSALDPQTRSADGLAALAEKLQELFVAGGARNEQLKSTIELLLQAENATRQLEGASTELLQTVETTGRVRKENAKAVAAATGGDSSDPYNLGFDTSIFKQAPVWLKEIEALDAGISDFGDSAAEGFNLAAEGSDIFLRAFDSAADGVARGTQSMSDAFESMVASILLQLGKLLAIRGIGTALSGQGGFLGQLGASLLTSGQGNAFSGGHHLTAYAKGGVVSGPTLFPMAKGAGLMGEAGPEAVLPLTRMSNGNLGVESSGMNVTINNNASGVAIRPRQTDDGLTIDVVMDAVSQAITRGGNDVSQSIENSYALNRGRAVYGN